MNFRNTRLWLFAVDIHRKQPRNDSETGAPLFADFGADLFTDYSCILHARPPARYRGPCSAWHP